ncbi:MAG: hypothetical protein K6A67_09955 [Bacteroidales bacterium]|nr:hypothetical protein [Bacteroidales bacterium]
MDRIRHYIVLLLLFVSMASGHSQVVDTNFISPVAISVYDSIDDVDSLAILRNRVEALTRRLDSTHVAQATLRNRMRELVALKDSLVYLNDLYQSELQDKNRLMSEQVVAMQEKERLLAEKEELYREALTNSTIDRAKWEGELKAKEASIDAKAREIDYLQKDIDAKEVTLRSQRENYEHVLNEKERYRHLVDSLQKRVNAIEIDNVRKAEENKYLQQKAKEAEEKAAITLNKKKKVRPIQGIAMRFFRTPDWDTRLSYNEDNTIRGAEIRNKNAGNIEFDFVTGASVMLWDLSDYFNGTKKDSLGNPVVLPDIRRFDQKFNYDLGIYVGFGGSNLFKNFYIGPSFRFVDFFYLIMGVNVCEYEILTGGYKEGDLLQGGSLKDITAKSWLVKPFIALSIDLDFLSYIKK